MNMKTRVLKLEKEQGKPSRLFITYDGNLFTSDGSHFTRSQVEVYQAKTGIEPIIIKVKYDEPKERKSNE
jgi:hypothetical protein